MMEKQEADILYCLYYEPFINQRVLSEMSGHSLGVVNRAVKRLIQNSYLDGHMQLTEKARAEFRSKRPENAIILAAGFGMRMVPINQEVPKALLEVNGEKLIDRLIGQLHEVGIRDITVVVGFMRDSFAYLTHKYGAYDKSSACGVTLVYNEEYAVKNNISSLNLVTGRLSNTYIVPCDLWCDRNPFRRRELYSWYMVNDMVEDASDVRANRRQELIRIPGRTGGNGMSGICYLTKEHSAVVRSRIKAFADDPDYDGKFWEEALYQDGRMIVRARVVHATDVVEVNTYEQLRELDCDSGQLKSDALDTIAGVLNCGTNDITDIEVLKKGMTNRSFLFTCRGQKYIMRIPGEGTDRLVNRRQEAEVYQAVSGQGLCDSPVFMDPENGYKITRFLSHARTCDTGQVQDLQACMGKLREFHGKNLQVGHTFDLFGQIEFYERLWDGGQSAYKDYADTKEKVFRLRAFIDAQEKQWCLTHIDAVCDNFLFYRNGDGPEELQLADWEYAGMQDPHLDIAMFAVYAFSSKREVDQLIKIYFQGPCGDAVRVKIYCYVAASGLLWSNWCEYKRMLGVEFGEYSKRQYRFAKDFCRYAAAGIKQLEETVPPHP